MISQLKDYIEYRKNKKRQESDIPFFNFNIVDVEGDGVKVEMDWNPAFIKQLREQKYPGVNDEEVVEAYLFKLFERNHYEKMYDEGLAKHSPED